MHENAIKKKSFAFAIRIVKLYQYLVSKKKEYVLSKQLLRCGTSIGANVREAQSAESKADFIHKLGIAQKETDEVLYWLELLKDTGYITKREYLSVEADAMEIFKLLRSIILTSKKMFRSS